LVDEWRLYDNTGHRPHWVARERDGGFELADASRPALLEQSAEVSFMPDPTEEHLEEAAALRFDDESRRSMRAKRKALADVVLENKAYGLPVIQWRVDKGVVEVPADQLEPFARRILEVDGDPLPEEEELALLAHVKV
jgi:hypothetical protein